MPCHCRTGNVGCNAVSNKRMWVKSERMENERMKNEGKEREEEAVVSKGGVRRQKGSEEGTCNGLLPWSSLQVV